jgi:hypothetical protein
MNDKALMKYYDRLTGDERFRLSLEANARDDTREFRRLKESCPIREYSGMDWDYTRRWNGSMTLVNRFVTLWLTALMNYHIARLNLRWARDTMDVFDEAYICGANVAWEEARQAGTYLTIEDIAAYSRRNARERRSFGRLEAIYEQRAAELKGVYLGFVRFCDRAMLNPDTLLVWFTPTREQIEGVRPLLDSAAPHCEETAAGICDILSASWPDTRTA